MAGITLTIAQAALDRWVAADVALATSQSYEIETNGTRRKLTRADAVEVRHNITFWDGKVRELTTAAGGGRRRIRYLVPE
jgi:hypothetical protein